MALRGSTSRRRWGQWHFDLKKARQDRKCCQNWENSNAHTKWRAKLLQAIKSAWNYGFCFLFQITGSTALNCGNGQKYLHSHSLFAFFFVYLLISNKHILILIEYLSTNTCKYILLKFSLLCCFIFRRILPFRTQGLVNSLELVGCLKSPTEWLSSSTATAHYESCGT